MPIVNPFNPLIKSIAFEYNSTHDGLLIKLIQRALCGSKRARRELNDDTVLANGYGKLQIEGVTFVTDERQCDPDNDRSLDLEYFAAVSHAQIFLRREPKLFNILKKRILEVYPEDRVNYVFKSFVDIAGTFGDQESNFLNLVIDLLKEVKDAKEIALSEGELPGAGADIVLAFIDLENVLEDYMLDLNQSDERIEQVRKIFHLAV